MGEQGCIFSKHIQPQFVALVLAKTSTFRWLKAPFVQVNVATLVDLLLGQSGYSEKGQPLLAVIIGSNDYSYSGHYCWAGRIDLPRPSPQLYFEEQCYLAGNIGIHKDNE